MASQNMHLDEIDIGDSLVAGLIASQYPEWTELRIERVKSTGTDNALFRLGDEMVVRLPRVPSASGQITKECEWLPKLAPRLPLEVPVPLKKGTPDSTYPWTWSVCRWLEGSDGNVVRPKNLNHTARELASFINILHSIDSADGPPPGEHNFFRGVPLAERSDRVYEAIESVSRIDTPSRTDTTNRTDTANRTDTTSRTDTLRPTDTTSRMYTSNELRVAWEISLGARSFEDSPVWIHGDLQAGNLLFAIVADQAADKSTDQFADQFEKEPASAQLSGVIDFGGLAVGDPACDLMPAWTMFEGESREIFRKELSIDDDTWLRGRGWCLSVALIALPYYLKTNATIAHNSRKAIEAVLDDLET